MPLILEGILGRVFDLLGPFQEEEEEDGRGIAGICAELIEAEEPITATATADTQ